MKGLIWGPTFEIADKKLNQIKEDYVRYRIPVEKETIGNHHHSILFENGDIWKALNFSESYCGERANISYVHHSLEEEAEHVRGMIRNCTYAGPWHGFCYYG